MIGSVTASTLLGALVIAAQAGGAQPQSAGGVGVEQDTPKAIEAKPVAGPRLEPLKSQNSSDAASQSSGTLAKRSVNRKKSLFLGARPNGMRATAKLRF